MMKLFNGDKSFSGSIMRFWSQAVVLIFVAIAYWVVVRLGLFFVAQPEGVASIWPASGLLLAILLLNPKSQWGKLLAVIFIANTAGNLSNGNSLIVSLGLALANMLEALLGAWVLTYFCRSKITFGRTVEIFALFGVAILSNGVTALLGAAVPALAFGAPFLKTWWIWWAADGLGIILVTPLIVTWATSQNMFQSVAPRRLVEASLLVLALAIFAWLIFGPFTIAENPILRNYMLFPILIWLAFRYSPRGMASTLILFTIIAISNTLQGHGIFGFTGQTVTEHLASVQIFLSVFAFSGLLLSAMVTERKQSDEKLRNAEVKYRTLIEKIPPIVYVTALQQHVGVNYISPRIQSLGYTQDEWVADPELWFTRIHPEDQDRVKEDIQKSIHANEPFRSEYRMLVHDGSVRWFLDEAVDIFNEAGVPVFRQGFMLDITTRKQAEVSLISRERYLALLNELTRTVLLSDDYNAVMDSLAHNLRKIIDADDCYILRWDDEKKLPIPITTTANLDFLFTEAPLYPEEIGLVATILRIGHVTAIDDVFNSPQINVETVRQYPAHSIIGIPLIVGDQKLGVAIIAFNSHHMFTDDEIKRAEQAGHQVALALWNVKQGNEIQQRLKESNALATISQALSESEHIGTGKVLQLIVDSARELIPNAEKSVVHLLEADGQSLTARAVSGFDEQETRTRPVKMRLGEGISGWAMREGITVNVGDVKKDPHYIDVDSSEKFNSLLVVPVQGGGQRIGTICVESNKINAFTNKDAELLDALALQANIAIENTRLFEKTQQSLKEVNTLYQISRGLATSLDADQLIREMIGLLQRIFDYYHVQIYLVDSETGDLVVKHGSGYIGDELIQRGHRLPAGEGIVGHVAEIGEPFMTNNVEDVSFFKRNPLLAQTQYEMAIPIKIDQQVAGVLDIQQILPHRFADGDLKLMTAIADQLAVVLQKANLYNTLQTSLQQEQMVRSQLVQSERLALVGRLLASVSHELSNPLQVMQYALSLLKEDESLSPQGKQDLDVVLSEAERMALLFERLRSAYRPGRMEDFQSIGLNKLVEDVYALISTHMRHKEIIFEFFPEPDLPNVSGLSDQLRQVLLNLFLNAVEIMGPGGRLTVLTRSLYPQNEITLTVKDTGPGIDPNILPHIFDAFITSKDTGTGLGLTITHDIIRQHRGRIVAENDPQGGAIFHIWLPIHERGEK